MSTGATLSPRGTRADLRMDYFPVLAHHLTSPLVTRGKEGIDEVIAVMDEYHLCRDDWDVLQELPLLSRPKGAAPPAIDSAVKTAFTRKFNSTHLASVIKGASRSAGALGADEDDAEGVVADGEGVAGPSAEGLRSDSDGEGGGSGADDAKDDLIVPKKRAPAAGKPVAKKGKPGAAKPKPSPKTGK
eukprot:RCo025348